LGSHNILAALAVQEGTRELRILDTLFAEFYGLVRDRGALSKEDKSMAVVSTSLAGVKSEIVRRTRYGL